ncbi:UNVERIFIED_ORG: hypothetical protein LHK14_23760 (plasmid) [Roseateles sp. XES5]|nr:hypothetical protein [Roseateles sp. XES5]
MQTKVQCESMHLALTTEGMDVCQLVVAPSTMSTAFASGWPLVTRASRSFRILLVQAEERSSFWVSSPCKSTSRLQRAGSLSFQAQRPLGLNFHKTGAVVFFNQKFSANPEAGRGQVGPWRHEAAYRFAFAQDRSAWAFFALPFPFGYPLEPDAMTISHRLS